MFLFTLEAVEVLKNPYKDYPVLSGNPSTQSCCVTLALSGAMVYGLGMPSHADESHLDGLHSLAFVR